MEKKRGKPTQRGMGSPHDVTDSQPPASSGLSRKTHRGLGDSQPPKLVTMHGVAPPSDRPPPLEQPTVGENAVEYSGDDLSFEHGEVPRFGDHELPPEVAAELNGDDQQTSVSFDGDRSQFRTAPGGGKNRLSGGRAAAAAYVSPSTLSPGHGTDPQVRPVEVAEHVLKEARSFQTEPSLVKKRASQLPPQAERVAPPMVQRSPWSGPAAGVIAALLVVGVYFLFRGEAGEEPPTLQKNAALAESSDGAPFAASAEVAASQPPPEVEPASSAGIATSAPPSPSVEPSSSGTGSAQPRPSLPPSGQKRRNEKSARPKINHASPSPPQPTSKPVSTKKRDLWLE